MKALWLADRQLQLRDDLPVPEPSAGEALVRVLRAGICNTDLEMVCGYYPFEGILGHEFVGRVETGPEGLLGQVVVGEINVSCGHCHACARGLTTHCERRQVLGIRNRDGAFADYLTLPAGNLHRVPDGVDLEAATFAEPLAAALEIQEQVSIDAGARVVVVGTGKLGRLIAQTLVLTDCDLQVIGRRPGEIVAGRDRTIDIDAVDDLDPRSADIAIECTGNPEGFAIAHRALRPRGKLVMKSTYVGALELDAAALVVDEITLIGSRCGPFPPALDLLASAQIDVPSLIADRLTLERGLEAFQLAGRPGTLKVLFEISEPEIWGDRVMAS